MGAGETDGLSRRVNCSERGWEMCQKPKENQILDPPHEVGRGIIKTSLQAKWCTNGIFSRNRLIKCRWNPSNWKMLFITWNTAHDAEKRAAEEAERKVFAFGCHRLPQHPYQNSFRKKFCKWPCLPSWAHCGYQNLDWSWDLYQRDHSKYLATGMPLALANQNRGLLVNPTGAYQPSPNPSTHSNV